MRYLICGLIGLYSICSFNVYAGSITADLDERDYILLQEAKENERKEKEEKERKEKEEKERKEKEERERREREEKERKEREEKEKNK